MVLPTDALDHHLNQRAGLLERVRKLDGFIATDVIGLQEQLRAGETTGLPLKDWAIRAHGEQYQEFMKAAMLVGSYLTELARASSPSLVVVYAEWSPNKTSVRYDLHVGVLADGGMNVVLDGTAPQIQAPCSIVYQEQGDIGERGRRHQNRKAYQNPIVLDGIITPSLSFDAQTRYFSSQTETAPHLTARLQAGTDGVRAYLREFWDGKEPYEATEFFRQITARITCEPAP